MTTRAPWNPPPVLRNKNLTPMEENILRMRFGWPAHPFSPVNRSADIQNQQTLKQLSRLEARLRVEATQPGRPHGPRRGPKE